MRWVTAKRLLFLAVLIAVTLTAMRATVPEQVRLAPTGAKFRDVIEPVQTGLAWVGRQVHYFISFPVSMIGATARSQALEQEVERLKSEIIELNEYKAESQRLAGLLHYKQVMAQRYDLLAASVIGRPGNWFGIVILNRGTEDGVQKDMAVLTPEGLVGRVISVSASTCEVLLITDPRSGVGSLIQDSRAPGIVQGTVGSTGVIQMTHIPNNAPAEAGQAVVTSGSGSVYPKGIPVGEIAGVRNEPSGLFLNAEIRPYANLNNLEEVFIVTFTQPETDAPPVGGQ